MVMDTQRSSLLATLLAKFMFTLLPPSLNVERPVSLPQMFIVNAQHDLCRLVTLKCKVANSITIKELRVCLVSLVYPGIGCLSVVAEVSASEPEPDLVVGRLHRVRAVDDVTSNLVKESI